VMSMDPVSVAIVVALLVIPALAVWAFGKS
jgi:hypothetical protein